MGGPTNNVMWVSVFVIDLDDHTVLFDIADGYHEPSPVGDCRCIFVYDNIDGEFCLLKYTQMRGEVT